MKKTFLQLLITVTALLTKQVAVAETLSWETFLVTTIDGVEVPAMIAKPTGTGPFPVVVYLHPAPGGRGLTGLQSIASDKNGGPRWQRLVNEGYAVVLSDYRGHEPTRPFQVLEGEYNAVDDLMAVLSNVQNRDYIDPLRIGIIGGSLGGAITLETLKQFQQVAKAVALEYPASQKYIGLKGQPPAGCVSIADSSINKAQALQNIATVNIPLFIAQGTQDSLCSVNKKLYELMVQSEKDVSIKYYENEKHGFTNTTISSSYQSELEDLVAFMKAHNPVNNKIN